MDGGYFIGLGLLLLVFGLTLAGCASTSGDFTPAETAAVTCILKGGQKCGK